LVKTGVCIATGHRMGTPKVVFAEYQYLKIFQLNEKNRWG